MNTSKENNTFWSSISVEEQEEITQKCIKAGLNDLLNQFKTVKDINSLNYSYQQTKIKLEILKLQNSIFKIIDFLFENNRYPSSFILFKYSNIIDHVVVDLRNNIVTINSNKFDFTIDSELKSCFEKSPNKIFNSNINNEILLDDFFFKTTLDSLTEIKKQPILVKTYLMTDASGYFKIGKSIDVSKRFKTLLIGNPSLSLIAISEKNVEKLLHKKFKTKNIIGEWFKLSSDEVLDIINEFDFKAKN